MSDVSKKARRDQARERARDGRTVERKRRSRNSLLIKIVVGLVLLAVAAGTVWGFAAYRQAQIDAATPKPGPANMLSDGIILQGDDTGTIVAARTPAIPAEGEPVATDPKDYADIVSIVVYLDYLCPFCQKFEAANAEQLTTWVSAGAATLEIHPIAFLDNASAGSRYSSRSANAMACVANFTPDQFFLANATMFTSQPPEGTSGLTNEEIVALLKTGGIDDEKVTRCIDNETFSQWVTAATKRTAEPVPNSTLEKIGGTPTVLVNGIKYPGDPGDAAAFDAFVTSIAIGTYEPAG